MPDALLSIKDVGVRSTVDGHAILRAVFLDVADRQVTGIIGPSGAGKSTLLRCINRLLELSPTLAMTGKILFRGTDVRTIPADTLRQRIGIVFQQPVTFPGSIQRNVVFAARKLGLVTRRNEDEAVERCLRDAGLWNEVKDRLDRPALTLSAGQQQRLAVARTLAGEPEVLLMDEPTSSLDAASTAALEETIARLRATRAIVLVTHHLEQARRLCDWVACICRHDDVGELVEADRCEVIFESPANPETAACVGLGGT
ncbi:MAG: ATP-binding cassette domain-containing protein [Acidobacteriota bacterium]